MRTIRLEEGKYEIDIDEHGLIVDMRRHGEPWPAALESFRYSKVFGAAMSHIVELEDERVRG